MKKINSVAISILIVFFIPFICVSQDYTDDDASKLFAQTKQVNQFMRRFNAEEDLKGERIDPKKPEYRSKELRFRYLQMLFDNSATIMPEDLKQKFVNEVVMSKNNFLSFYDENWYAEVSNKFIYKGKEVDIILFLKIEKENGGYKWVISNLYFDKFNTFFIEKTDTLTKFIQPMSHELDFMNLRRVFEDSKNIEYYYDNEYVPDYKTLFLYEIKNKNLTFSEVAGVKFHFFSIPGYYFEIQNFNREGYNSGWLISNLLEIKEKDMEMMKQKILGR